MSYQDHRSRHAVGRLKAYNSASKGPNPESDETLAMDTDEPGDLDRNLELETLTRSPDGSKYFSSTSGPEFEDAYSDEESFPKSRRASASTLQSFMLYNPDEERSVIRKFDCRLVLFVALLYMLSFLNRSSMFLHLISRSVLNLVRHRKSKNCRFIRGFTSELLAI